MSTPEESLARLPYKQRLGLQHKSILSALVDRYGKIGMAIADADLRQSLEDVLGVAGIPFQSLKSDERNNLLQRFLYWQESGALILLHYKQIRDGENVLNFLRAAHHEAPLLRNENVIPIFVASPTSQKQQKVFRVLGQFGVRYALFLPPPLPADQKVERILAELSSFFAYAQNNFVGEAPGDDPNAIPHATRQVDAYREFIAKGDALMEAGEFEEAISFFTQAIENEPSFETLMRRGDAYYETRKYPSALTDYREACSLSARTPDPYAKVSACCFSLVTKNIRMGKEEQAQKWLAMGLKTIATAEKKVTELLTANKKTPEMIAPDCYGSLITALCAADFRGLDLPKATETIAALTGRVLERTKNIDYRSSAIAVKGRLNKAIILIRIGFYQEAEDIFRSIIDQNPEEVGPLFNNFAIELRRGGHYGKAFGIYLECLKYKAPDRDIIIRNMRIAGQRYADTLRADGDAAKAIAVYKNMLSYVEKTDGMEWVLCDMAMCYLELMEQGKAASAFVEALYLNPNLIEMDSFAPYSDLLSIGKEIAKKFTRGAL